MKHFVVRYFCSVNQSTALCTPHRVSNLFRWPVFDNFLRAGWRATWKVLIWVMAPLHKSGPRRLRWATLAAQSRLLNTTCLPVCNRFINLDHGVKIPGKNRPMIDFIRREEGLCKWCFGALLATPGNEFIVEVNGRLVATFTAQVRPAIAEFIIFSVWSTWMVFGLN